MAHYTIKLNKNEVEEFNNIINKGRHTSQAFRTAYILLNCDKGEFSENKEITNAELCKILKVGERTIGRVKKKFLEEGFKKNELKPWKVKGWVIPPAKSSEFVANMEQVQ